MFRERRRTWISWNPVDCTYSGYLAEVDEDGREVAKIDDAPDGLDFHEIIGWARASAAQVLIRPHWDSGTTYWAGDGDHRGLPLLDPTRAGEPADTAPERSVVISGVLGNCAHCDWHGTFDNHADLAAAYGTHAVEAHLPQE